ncbi:MAG TPA: hypothetical protein VF069_16550 [Streptosporangiaceae bacterium]
MTASWNLAAGPPPSCPPPERQEWRLSCRTVDRRDIAALASGGRLAGVFDPVERAHSGRHKDLTGFAGRLAAKYAVADLLGLPADDDDLLKGIQILPSPRNACRDPARCERGHPPTVRFRSDHSGLDTPDRVRLLWIDVSIAHETDRAVAAAFAVLAPGHTSTWREDA